MSDAVVNRIIDSSVVDGPGNRTAIFLQGCTFQCTYCHNPETMGLCCGCGACVALCPAGALYQDETGVRWAAERCVGCDRCTSACPYHSSPKTRRMSARQAAQRAAGNMPFIRGITLSGGECTCYPDFIRELFELTAALGLDNLLDSNGSMDFSQSPEILDHCSGVMLDIKATDDVIHRAVTGMSNQVVLDNARYLAQLGKLPEIRTVVIPELLDNEGTVDAVTRLLAPYQQVRAIRYRLIRYRPHGVRRPFRERYAVPSAELMERLRDRASKNGWQQTIIT